ncbi:MAG: carboxylate/amino acid/amine transporter [Desulfobacteraceae bacterium]|nr:carboxylate/amino acid/amine transporter [Desulfobacteraceae bacterium]
MGYLWFVTILWAFSFSLIGVYLSGQVDSYFAVFSRTFLASLMFLPLIRWPRVSPGLALKLMAIGGIQLGLMFICFYNSFSFLSVPEVVLFTVFTPIYITLLYDLLKKRFTLWYLVTAIVAVAGAAVIRYNPLSRDFATGFLLVQAANICFAIGQVAYKRLMEKRAESGMDVLPQHSVFGFFYLGALIVSVAGWLIWGDFSMMPATYVQWGVLLWLGVAASGIGYFLWNKGATMVNQGALAIMNNALVPAALVVNLVIWNRDEELLRLLIGGCLILFALWFNQSWVKPRMEQRRADLFQEAA